MTREKVIARSFRFLEQLHEIVHSSLLLAGCVVQVLLDSNSSGRTLLPTSPAFRLSNCFDDGWAHAQ